MPSLSFFHKKGAALQAERPKRVGYWKDGQAAVIGVRGGGHVVAVDVVVVRPGGDGAAQGRQQGQQQDAQFLQHVAASSLLPVCS